MNQTLPQSSQSLPQSSQHSHIRRTWDVRREMHIVHIHPGELHVTKADELISTLLGSCIAVCMRDKFNGVGGMNHFRLPTGNSAKGIDTNYGMYAMEVLINEILKNGGKKHHLECAVFGGGNVIQTITSNIGGKNIDFTMSFLKKESIPVVYHDVGHVSAQQVFYHPVKGKFLSVVKNISSLEEVKKAEQEYLQDLKADIEQSSITYF